MASCLIFASGSPQAIFYFVTAPCPVVFILSRPSLVFLLLLPLPLSFTLPSILLPSTLTSEQLGTMGKTELYSLYKGFLDCICLCLSVSISIFLCMHLCIMVDFSPAIICTMWWVLIHNFVHKLHADCVCLHAVSLAFVHGLFCGPCPAISVSSAHADINNSLRMRMEIEPELLQRGQKSFDISY